MEIFVATYLWIYIVPYKHNKLFSYRKSILNGKLNILLYKPSELYNSKKLSIYNINKLVL